LSGFEIITITFSFILGLGVAQVLRSVAFVVREKQDHPLHWIPFSVAAMVLFFQVQFWFGLVVVDSIMKQWTWPAYSLMLVLAMLIFLSGATILPPPSLMGERSVIEDFETRGRVSLLFLALYLLGWIGVAMMFWTPAFWHLVAVNGSMAVVLYLAYASRHSRIRALLHLVLLVMTFYGMLTVWTTPNLQNPF